MAAPWRRPVADRRVRDAEFAVLDALGDAVPASRTPRLRVAGTPELVSDDDHPDFAHLPRYRRT